MLTVTMLGTAATLPLPERALSAAVFTVSGRHILLDCGEGTQLSLHRRHISPVKIDLIALTHYHGDHILGLPGLLQTMDTLGRTHPLTITGPQEGHAPILGAILTLADALSFPVTYLPMPPQGLDLSLLHPGWARAALTAFPTLHRVPSQGYALRLDRMQRLDADKALALGIPREHWRTLQNGQCIQHEGRTVHPGEVCGGDRPGLRVVFTGDTAPCSAVEAAAHSADLLLMDATYADPALEDKAALYGHSTFAQAAQLACRAGVRRLWLTHFSAMIADPAAHIALAQAHFPGAVCAREGDVLCLTFQEKETGL